MGNARGAGIWLMAAVMGIGVTSPAAAVADEEATRSKRMRIAWKARELQRAMRAAADAGVPVAVSESVDDVSEEWTDTGGETRSEAEAVEPEGAAADEDEWAVADEVEGMENLEDPGGLDESSDFEESTGFEDVAGFDEGAVLEEDAELDEDAELEEAIALEDVADVEEAADPEAGGRDWVGGARSILDGLDKILKK